MSNVRILMGTNFTLIRMYAQVDVGGNSSICEDTLKQCLQNRCSGGVLGRMYLPVTIASLLDGKENCGDFRIGGSSD